MSKLPYKYFFPHTKKLEWFHSVLQRFMWFMFSLLRSERFVLPVNVILFYFIDVCFHVSAVGSFPEGAQHPE